MIVDVQFSPASTDWPRLRSAAIAAEARGFGAIHVFDHLAGVPLGGSTMLECFTVLGCLAEVTESIELGTMVANVWNRQVGTLVTGAATVTAVSRRRFLFGIGAGASPGSDWALEQRLVGAELEPDLALRHARVEAVLDLAESLWSTDRDEMFATFPLPVPKPTIIVGVNSVGLSRLAGRRADGINVQWNHARRDEFLAAADAEAADRRFLRTAYISYDEALLDPSHPTRVDMAARRIDRLVLAVFDDLGAWSD
ncbi:MAG: LLM class flavin-dependent oxidoreductase [Ilumatobacteraceae bacterium]